MSVYLSRFPVSPAAYRAETLRSKGISAWRAYSPVWVGLARHVPGGRVNGLYIRCWPARKALLLFVVGRRRRRAA